MKIRGDKEQKSRISGAANSPHFQQEGIASAVPPKQLFSENEGEGKEEVLQNKGESISDTGGSGIPPFDPGNPRQENILNVFQKAHKESTRGEKPKQFKRFEPKNLATRQFRKFEPFQLSKSKAYQNSLDQNSNDSTVQAKCDDSGKMIQKQEAPGQTHVAQRQTPTPVPVPTPTETPTPVSTPTPAATPTAAPANVIACSSMPRQIFSRGACGAGTDFTHNDFPALSGASVAERAAVWEADNLTMDFQLRNRMRLELGLLAGGEGLRMVNHFTGGSGTKLTHGPSSALGPLALASGTFTTLHAAVASSISSQLSSMDAGGTIDCNAIALAASAVPAAHFSFGDSWALKGIIGGNQGLTINLTNFHVDPATRTFSFSLQYLICDDFGVDDADLYSPALIAFWVLQHRRSGNLPFINEVDLPKTERGTY